MNARIEETHEPHADRQAPRARRAYVEYGKILGVEILEHCPACGPGPKLFRSERPLTSEEYVEAQWCPKCGWEKSGGVRSGAIIVEHAWSVLLRFEHTPSVKDLVTLRRLHASLEALTPVELLARARAKGEITVNDIPREEAHRIVDAASKLGLICTTF